MADDTIPPLDDQDEFNPPPFGIMTPEQFAQIQRAAQAARRARDNSEEALMARYPQIIPGTIRMNTQVNKREADIRCVVPNCPTVRTVFTNDLFQINKCVEHHKQYRAQQRAERQHHVQELLRAARQAMNPDLPMESTDAPPLDDKDEFVDPHQEHLRNMWNHTSVCPKHYKEMKKKLKTKGPVPPVSDVPVTEELGGIRPAHLLVKAKNDASWIEYVDNEGNTKFMQVHDVRSARDAFGRWAVYGIDQKGEPVHELYDLRHGYEHSGTFSGIRELQFGEIVKLAQQGVIRGEGGKQIQTLAELMQIADEPLRAMINKKMREARAGGPSLAAIEKQLFAGPAKSSAQKRRTGKAGTSPWPKSMSL